MKLNVSKPVAVLLAVVSVALAAFVIWKVSSKGKVPGGEGVTPTTEIIDLGTGQDLQPGQYRVLPGEPPGEIPGVSDPAAIDASGVGSPPPRRSPMGGQPSGM